LENRSWRKDFVEIIHTDVGPVPQAVAASG